jgi:uncharacterized protein YhaN
MRLTGWHVDAFGALHDVGVRDLPDGLVVLHGPNASGKSTLLAFLRRTLFGHPHRNARDVNHYEPTVPGRRRGGRILLATAEVDGEMIVERHDGTGLRVIRPDESLGDPGELDELTGGCDERLFNAVFAFDLDDLRSIDSLTDDAVRDRLFSAGVRGAGRSARSVVDRLDRQARDLWTPRSRTAEIDGLQDRVREVGAQLDEARRLAASHPERRAEERRCLMVVEELDGRLAEAEVVERHHETLLAAWPVWQRQRADQHELEELGDVDDLPDDLLEQHERTRTALEGSAERLAALGAEHDRLAARLDELAVDGGLEAVAQCVVALDEERTAQLERLDRLDALDTEAASLRRQHERALAALGPGWDDRRVSGLDLSVEVRGTVRDWRTRLDRAHRELEDAERVVRQAEAEQQRARGRVERATDRMDDDPAETPPPTHDAIERDRDRVAALRTALIEADAAEAALAAARSGRIGRDAPLWVVSALGGLTALVVIGAVLAALAGARAVVAVLTVVVLVLLGLVWGSRRSRPGEQAEDPLAVAHARARHAADDLAVRAAELGIGGTPTFEHAERMAADVDRRRERRLRLDQLVEVRARDEAELVDAQQELGRACAARDRAHEALRELTGAWRTWCHRRDLPPELDPATVTDLVDAVERVRQGRERLDGVEAEAASLRVTVDDFAARARAVLDADGATHRARHAELVEGVRRMAALVTTNRERVEERDRLCRRLAELAEELATEQARHTTWTIERDGLLRSARATDTASLRTAVGRSRRRRELLGRLRQAELDLGDHLGTGEAADRLRRRLATGARGDWETTAEEARQRRRRLRTERDEALAALLEARRRREEAESSELVADLDRERQALLTRRDDLVHEWRVTRLAGRLVSRTLEGFERERQPGVLRRAGEHFARVTGDEYRGLVQQGEHLLLVDADRQRCDVEVLSRGTAEQLYLCLRLALAEDLAERAPQLPFVMDDVLVNVDPTRCHRLAQLLAEVADDHQVLYFTCHPHTVALLEQAGAAAVYDLGPDGATPVRRTG